MSLLQVDDVLRHWMLHHNVSLDLFSRKETWPSQVACIADLLSIAEIPSQRTAVTDFPERHLAHTICPAMPWRALFASIMEDSVPGVTTLVDCEFMNTMPVNLAHCCSDLQYMDRTSLKGIASLLVLVPVNLPSPNDGYLHAELTESPMARPFTAYASDEASSDADASSHRQVQLGSDNTPEGVSDVTDDFSISIEVEIHDELVEASDPSGHASRANVTRHDPQGFDATSVSTGCSSASHCNTSPFHDSASCRQPLSSSDAHRPLASLALGAFYDEVPVHILQQHLLPTPYYPSPLVPLLCVADERNIVPLMCAALHQRHALGLCDSPVVGILLPHADGDAATCEVLLGWMAREQLARVPQLPRTHIAVAASSLAGESRCGGIPRTVYDLRCPRSRLCLARFLAALGPHVARSLSDCLPPRPRPSDSCCVSLREPKLSPSGYRWRADSHLSEIAAREGRDAQIVFWAHEVRCSNLMHEDEEELEDFEEDMSGPAV